MAPSAALQARIRQFESLENAKSAAASTPGPGRASYPPLRPFSPVSVHSTASSSSNPLEDPVSPTVASYTIIQPTVPYVPRKPRVKSPSPSPPNLGLKTSLIDLREWVVEDSILSSTKAKFIQAGNGSNITIVPPLPPRRNSQLSSHATGPGASRSRSSNGRSPSSNTLTVEHTYPPLSKTPSTSNLRQSTHGHVHASSTSSFHSVSLSSDGGNETILSASPSSTNPISDFSQDSRGERSDHDKGKDSFDDSFSFESLSSVGMSSPNISTPIEWIKDSKSLNIKRDQPILPPRRQAQSAEISSPVSATFKASPPVPSAPRPVRSLSTQSNVTRRAAPPPPLRHKLPAASSSSSLQSTASGSDRSTILSSFTITRVSSDVSSPVLLHRPTPVPGTMRKRYEVLFFANLNAQRRVMKKSLSPNASELQSPNSPSTPRKGWRGLSVDLITNPEDHPFSPSSEEDQLDGRIVQAIWSKSKLNSDKLKDIWTDCATPGRKSLDKESFVKGMWRIDEELRRVHNPTNLGSSVRSRPERQSTVDSLLS